VGRQAQLKGTAQAESCVAAAAGRAWCARVIMSRRIVYACTACTVCKGLDVTPPGKSCRHGASCAPRYPDKAEHGVCSMQVASSPASALTGQPTAALIFSQCLSRRPGFLSAVMRGMCCWKACSWLLTPSATSSGAPDSCLRSLALLRHHLQNHGRRHKQSRLYQSHVRWKCTPLPP